MRTLLFAFVLTACASGNRGQPPAPAATVMAGSMPSNAPAPEHVATPDAGPLRARPQVAAPGTAAPIAPGPSATRVEPSPPPPPAETGPMTAAEAAAELASRYSEGQKHNPTGDTVPFGDAGGAEDAPCASDGDCTTTRVAPHACCPMLCEPRAVTKKAAEVIEAHVKSCAMFKCPEPACRPPRQPTAPACVQNRCVMKPVGPRGPA